MSQRTVTPDLPSGFRDYLPAEAIARAAMLATIRSVFERFGFDPLETPGVERWGVLTGNDPNFRMVLFETTSTGVRRASAADDRTALRFDLTVPLARVVAANGDLPKPFLRYQIGNVWRGERPQAGRYREFTQCDADIVGTATPVADAQMLTLVDATLRALGVTAFEMRLNNRKILNGLPAYAGFDPALTPEVLRVMDKLPKIGREAVLRELTRSGGRSVESEEGADDAESKSGVGLSGDAAEKIGAFLDCSGDADTLLTRLDAMFGAVPTAVEGVRELRAIAAALRASGVPASAWRVDCSIARGLGYYTGPVFETYLTDLPGIGSVCSGGRYDGLVSRFSDATLPATGMSIGIDRLFAALTELGRIPRTPTGTDVLVTVMDPDAMSEYLAITAELRAAGVRTMLWVGEDTAFPAQLAYAVRQEIPAVVIVGSDERAQGTVTVKDMRRRAQSSVPRTEVVAAVQAVLANV